MYFLQPNRFFFQHFLYQGGHPGRNKSLAARDCWPLALPASPAGDIRAQNKMAGLVRTSFPGIDRPQRQIEHLNGSPRGQMHRAGIRCYKQIKALFKISQLGKGKLSAIGRNPSLHTGCDFTCQFRRGTPRAGLGVSVSDAGGPSPVIQWRLLTPAAFNAA